MLDLTSYKSVLEAMDQLSAWLEQAKSHADMPSNPPKELVAQFEAALNRAETVAAPSAITTTTNDVIAESSLFSETSANSARPVDTDISHRPVQANQELITVTDLERINVDRGMQTLKAVHGQDAIHVTQKILQILGKDAADLKPTDLLQLQQYMVAFKAAGEAGKSGSEGVSETLETILDSEG